MWIPLFAACAPDPASPGSADRADTDSGPVDSGSPRCASTAGSSEETLTVDGEPRRFLVRTPDRPGPVPLVVDLHGTFSTAEEQRFLSGLDDAVDPDGFAAVWPDSEEAAGLKAWLLTCSGRDVDFVSALIDHLEATRCIDPDRVVVTGLSNGGYFTNLLGSVLASKIAAIAPVSGGLGAVPLLCRPTAPMPVTLVHGTADDVVPISEGEDARDLWAEVDGCSAPTTDADGCTVASCDAGATVRFCAAEGVGHVLIYAQYDTADRIRERVAGTASR